MSSPTSRSTAIGWRTGLTAIAVGVGTGGIAPKLAGERHWAYVAVGIGFAALGVALLLMGIGFLVLVAGGAVRDPETALRFLRSHRPHVPHREAAADN